MGQKVYPIRLRLGITENGVRAGTGQGLRRPSRATRDSSVPQQAPTPRRVSRVEIERKGDKTIVIELWTARPGIVIGKKGAEVDVLRKEIEKITGGQVAVNIVEIKRPELDATLIAQSVAEQLEGRVAFRRAMRKAVASAMKSGAKGIRIQCSGRLGGAEMGRASGTARVACRCTLCAPRSTTVPPDARTTMGAIGVKVWVYHGEVLPGQEAPDAGSRGRPFPGRVASEGR
jgi:small subunit ribosomal protein S3